MKFNLLFHVLLSLFVSILPQYSFAGRELTSAETSQISSLLDTFAPGCSLTSPSTQDAIALVRGLNQTLAATRDSNCESISGVLSRMQQAQIRAEGWMPWVHEDFNNSTDLEVSGLIKEKEQALFLLTQTTDPDEIASLKSEIRTIELDLARTRGEQGAINYNERRERQSRALQELVSAANASMNQMLSNETCWINKPGLLRELGSVAVGIGGAATIASPVSQSAMIMGAGASLLASVFSFFDRLKIEKKIAQFDMILNPTALTCTLERMSEIYCSSRDSLKAIELSGQNVHGTDPIWQGIKILEKDLPRLIGWLERLQAGGAATDISGASERMRTKMAETQLRESPPLAMAVVREEEKLYNELKTDELKFQSLKAAAMDVGNSFCPYMPGQMMNYSNPICDVYSPDYIPFYLLGISKTDRELLGKAFGNKIFQLSEIELNYFTSAGIPFQADMNTIRKNFFEWHRLATEKFAARLKLTTGGDLELIFAEAIASNSYSEQTGDSPMGALGRIKDFLLQTIARPQNPPPPGSGAQSEILAKVLDTLNEISGNIDAVANRKTDATGNVVTPDIARTNIMAKYNLDETTSDLQDALAHLIKNQMDRLILDGQQVPEDIVIQWLAANDYVSELKKYYGDGRVSLEQLATQAEETQNIVTRTLPAFMSTFASPIGKAIGQTAGRPKTLLCFQLLMSKSYSLDFSHEGCNGVQGKTLTPNGVTTPVFSSALFKLPFAERTCMYRDFLRKNMIIQNRGRLPGHGVMSKENQDIRSKKENANVLDVLLKRRYF